MTAKYVPEFNCMIRGILKKVGAKAIPRIRMRHGDLACVLKPDGGRYITLVPNHEGDGAGPVEHSWGVGYRYTSFPVRLGEPYLTTKGWMVDVFMEDESVEGSREIGLYLHEESKYVA